VIIAIPQAVVDEGREREHLRLGRAPLALQGHEPVALLEVARDRRVGADKDEHAPIRPSVGTFSKLPPLFAARAYIPLMYLLYAASWG
jgi:hypothetical protein